MKFFVVKDIPKGAHKSCAYLQTDAWDDWGKFRTQFWLSVFDAKGAQFDAGAVKIGERGLRAAAPGKAAEGKRAPDLPDNFSKLPAKFFSLGQDENYFETLRRLGVETAEEVFKALRDCAFDNEIFRRFESEEVMQESLLRSVRRSTVTGRLNRLAHGNVALTAYHFSYSPPAILESASPQLSFRVHPFANPPTNVHVLIGRNGAGKTRFLQTLAQAILTPKKDKGELNIKPAEGEDWDFASLVYISFSVFDSFSIPKPARSTLRAAQVSLSSEDSVADRDGEPTKAGAKAFANSFAKCRGGERRKRWGHAIAALESDSLFEEAGIKDLIDLNDDQWKKAALKKFGELSSGHAVVLLTVTRLVELVDEHTLVLFDEPEGHLHPPLLSALVRALSNLLIERNGVAVIATHSPVVLQEVPRSCVWTIDRSGGEPRVERPAHETFGENVGTLTSEVFGLEVTRAGFHKLIADAVERDGSYDEVLRRFNEELGAEARAIVRGLLAARTHDEGV